MKPYRLLDVVTLINASPPFSANALSTAVENVESPKGTTAMTKKRQASP